MADRYWVGGTGTWNTSSTTNWSTSPGGSSGASVPTAADSVFFDQAGTYTVTFFGPITCLNFNVSAGTITFAGVGQGVTISGSMSITNVTPTWSATGVITFNSTTTGRTVTTNGVSFAAPFTFNGTGGGWTLGSSLTSTSATAFSILAGTLNTSAVSNYGLTVNNISLAFTATAGLVLNASTVTITGISSSISSNTVAGFNAGTSQINFTSTGGFTLITNGSQTFYNVSFTGAGDPGQTYSVGSPCVFNNFSIRGPASQGSKFLTFSGTQTINGIFSTISQTNISHSRITIQGGTSITFDMVINGSTSLIDTDFRNIRVRGTAAPISGTRIGNLTGCAGITFSTPKTLYRPGSGTNWAGGVTSFSLTSTGGTGSFDNYPLPQDTIIFDNNTGGGAGATVIMEANIYCCTIDMSARTTAFTLQIGANLTVYGNFKLSSSITISGSTTTITFAGGNTQTITSAGRTINHNILIDSTGGIVELADALNISSNTLTVTNGTFDTKNFNVTAQTLSSSGSDVRTINLGSSTVTLSSASAITCSVVTNLTFNAGTSTIICSAASPNINSGGLTFYDVSFTDTASSAFIINGVNTYRNLTFASPAASSVREVRFSANQTITGTLTCAGFTTARNFLRSNTLGTARTLTVNSLSAADCDFRDITIAGAAAGSSPTRAGNCGGNSGITFPAAKTVYWNLAGTREWSAVAWAPSSGGTPNINNFPLAQDTAVFDDAGAAGTVSIGDDWNIGTFNASNRTTAMTLTTSVGPTIYGNWLFGTGVTNTGTATTNWSGRGTQTITSNGRTFTQRNRIDNVDGTVQLADAYISTTVLELESGTFDAVSYNVTVTTFTSNTTPNRALRMGSGIWTLTGTSFMWNVGSGGFTSFSSGTSTILCSDTSTSGRTFNGAGFFYNKLTIGGATGTSTFTLFTNDTFGELASTKTVAHTIAIGSNLPRIGKWSVTGTAGNVVTLTGSGGITLIGERVSGVDYLAMGTIAMTATNPVEFYAGANSTGTGAGVILTAAPAPVTRYWRGGTGTWNAATTTNWSDTSGGAGGFSVPTSADTVIFDSASNATAYTVTLTATQLRCASLSVSGPASGNVTFAGTAPLSVTQSLTMASSGITRTWTNGFTFAGTGSGKTISCGQTIQGGFIINGVGASWALTSAFTTSGAVTLTNGSFDTAGFALIMSTLSTSAGVTGNPVTLSLGASTITSSAAGGGINFAASSSTYNPTNLTFNAGTSTININGNGNVFYHGGKTFHNVALNDTTAGVATPLNQSIFTPTFNNFTIATASLTGFKTATLSSNLIINGTFTVTASTGPSRKLLLVSDTLGTQRTITAAAVSGLQDIDMRDINCAGAATWTGTRIGDLGGNTNAPTSTPKTVYWNLAGGGSFSGAAWATESGGSPSALNMPLAQDTAIIENTGLNTSATITIDANWHIGTINMSNRTNAMTFTTGSTTPTIYGDWIFGAGVGNAGSSAITFAKRGTQTITSNGRTFTQPITINSFNGTVQLADALTVTTSTLTHTSGTFDAVSYGVAVGTFNSSNSNTRTLSMGSGLWTITSTSTMWNLGTTTGLTFNKGTANIITTAASGNIIFAGGGLAYNKLTIAGGTNASSFTISGNNTFTEIASTRAVAYTIALATTTQRVGAFTAAGGLGRLLTITGTNQSNPAALVYTGAGTVNVSFIVPTFLRVYDTFSDWTATNGTNGGSYGFLFATAAIVIPINGQFFAFF